MIKAFVFALLAANTAYFAIAGTTSKAIDAAAWLILLALFELESHPGTHLRSRYWQLRVRIARLVAGAGVVAATIGYVFEDNALDAINSALWIAVIVLLEIEVRYRPAVQRARVGFVAAAACLYGALALLVVIWAARGQWFDAYDALLWLFAFGAVELRLVSDKISSDASITPG